MIDISVDGLREAEKAIADKRAEMVAQLETTVGEAAENVRDEWRSRVAVDSGDYLEAIGIHHDGLEASVGVFDEAVGEYAVYPEFGTSKQPAQPAAQPASEIERARLEQRIRDALG